MSNFNSTLTAERLREVLHYDPETGIFTRLVRTAQRVQVGDTAGCKGPRGCLLIMFDTPELAHAAYLAEKRLHHPGCTI